MQPVSAPANQGRPRSPQCSESILSVLPGVLADAGSLPDWAHWIAMDADGSWWAYEVEPLMYHRGWYENELGRRLRLDLTRSEPDWRESLRRLA